MFLQNHFFYIQRINKTISVNNLLTLFREPLQRLFPQVKNNEIFENFSRLDIF